MIMIDILYIHHQLVQQVNKRKKENNYRYYILIIIIIITLGKYNLEEFKNCRRKCTK